jgi:hypothetical protein
VSTAAQKGTAAENKKVVSSHGSSEKCAGCSEELKEGQALMALDKQVRRRQPCGADFIKQQLGIRKECT